MVDVAGVEGLVLGVTECADWVLATDVCVGEEVATTEVAATEVARTEETVLADDTGLVAADDTDEADDDEEEGEDAPGLPVVMSVSFAAPPQIS